MVLSLASEGWREHAACATKDPTLFDWMIDEENHHTRLYRFQRAKRICATCPVQKECLESARNDHESGVRAGFIILDGRFDPRFAQEPNSEPDRIRTVEFADLPRAAKSLATLAKDCGFDTIFVAASWFVEKEGGVVESVSVRMARDDERYAATWVGGLFSSGGAPWEVMNIKRLKAVISR